MKETDKQTPFSLQKRGYKNGFCVALFTTFTSFCSQFLTQRICYFRLRSFLLHAFHNAINLFYEPIFRSILIYFQLLYPSFQCLTFMRAYNFLRWFIFWYMCLNIFTMASWSKDEFTEVRVASHLKITENQICPLFIPHWLRSWIVLFLISAT